MPQGSEFQNFWTSLFKSGVRSGMERALATRVNLGWMLAQRSVAFATFADVLCELAGKILTAKCAEGAAKVAKNGPLQLLQCNMFEVFL